MTILGIRAACCSGCTRVPGGGKLILTGQLGDVMKESGQAALSLIKSRAQALGVDPAVFEKSDIHVQVPAGATPKDGPSAGVAMFLALASLVTGRPVRSDTAMTGEISLRRLVLPIGGVKEKVLAALRAGIERVMLPARNRKDLHDVPAEARDRLSPGAAAAIGVLGGLAVGGAIAASQQPAYAAPAPVYVAPAPRPVYVAPRRVIVEEDCWTERTREWVPGWGWQHHRRTVCR